MWSGILGEGVGKYLRGELNKEEDAVLGATGIVIRNSGSCHQWVSAGKCVSLNRVTRIMHPMNEGKTVQSICPKS
jgi:hypothetical protein